MAGITTQEVGLSMDWGVKGVEYKYDTKKVDFQDLMIAISQKRATTVEGEVVPLSTRNDSPCLRGVPQKGRESRHDYWLVEL